MGTATSPEKSTVAVWAISVASRRWAAGGPTQWRGFGDQGDTERSQERLLHCRDPLEGYWVQEPSCQHQWEGQAAWESCQQHQDGHAGNPLSSVQIQDERLGGAGGPFTLLSQQNGSRVRIFNTSSLFWRSEGDNPDPLSAPSQQRRLWFLTVKKNKDNDTNNSYCICTASAGGRETTTSVTGTSENCSQLQGLNKILWTKGASHNSNRTESG